jgi:hypothetical protein
MMSRGSLVLSFFLLFCFNAAEASSPSTFPLKLTEYEFGGQIAQGIAIIGPGTVSQTKLVFKNAIPCKNRSCWISARIKLVKQITPYEFEAEVLGHPKKIPQTAKRVLKPYLLLAGGP